jgi:hypothetical protein
MEQSHPRGFRPQAKDCARRRKGRRPAALKLQVICISDVLANANSTMPLTDRTSNPWSAAASPARTSGMKPSPYMPRARTNREFSATSTSRLSNSIRLVTGDGWERRNAAPLLPSPCACASGMPSRLAIPIFYCSKFGLLAPLPADYLISKSRALLPPTTRVRREDGREQMEQRVAFYP